MNTTQVAIAAKRAAALAPFLNQLNAATSAIAMRNKTIDANPCWASKTWAASNAAPAAIPQIASLRALLMAQGLSKLPLSSAKIFCRSSNSVATNPSAMANKPIGQTSPSENAPPLIHNNPQAKAPAMLK